MNLPQVYMCSPSWTLLPPLSPYHPSGSSQCTSPKHPVSCIEPGLATRFIHDIRHVSMPFSQIIPPFPSPTESIGLFYISLSLLLSRQQWRKRHREQIYGHRGGEKREGERYGESNMKTYITICKIYSQWEFAVWLRKLKQELCINLEGWDVGGRVGGWEGGSKWRGYMCTYGWLMSRFDRKQQNSVKQLFFN